MYQFSYRCTDKEQMHKHSYDFFCHNCLTYIEQKIKKSGRWTREKFIRKIQTNKWSILQEGEEEKSSEL